jgi:hypothetical protein
MIADIDKYKHEFLEENYNLCGFGPRAGPEIWLASGYALHPSLGRKRKFSYLIDRRHPVFRQALNVPYFNRRDFVRRLRITVGGQEVSGQTHPKWISGDGKSVPVPGHNELARRTCRKILRQLRINAPLSQFMSAGDDELRMFRPPG